MPAVQRILDANANRAREALRVMEDVARFALDDATLARELKELRHALRDALASLPAGWIEAGREVETDVGREISTENERSRRNLADVATAAGKRLSEALRSIEECLKLADERAAAEVEQLRYRAYEVDARLALRTAPLRAKQWGVCVLLTESICKRPWREVLLGSIAGGADAVQVREKHMTARELCNRVREVIDIARPANVTVIINDRVDVALACGADSVHLGTEDIAIADARRAASRTLLIGASTHSLAEAEHAVAQGADYCGVGMMYASSVKPDREPEGMAYLQKFLARFPHMPHLAIGGVTPENAAELVAAGARGFAVSTAVCAANDPEAVVRSLCDALKHARQPVPAS